MKLSIIFQPRLVDGGKSPNEQIFVEVNDDQGNSIDAGEWITDGEHEALVIDCAKHCETIDVKHLKQLDDVTAVAVHPGNAMANDYMRGMANGLILAQSVFSDKEPEYINPDGTRSIGQAVTVWIDEDRNARIK